VLPPNEQTRNPLTRTTGGRRVRFEWDHKKALANLLKHRVSFDEATEVFYDPNVIEALDEEHSDDETRFLIVGYSASRLLTVIFTERRDDVIRIISARSPTPNERRSYEKRRR
jgi:uncharacterized DUF497 family protein